MKKPSIIIFNFINPFKKGLFISIDLNLTGRNFGSYYFLIQMIFFHIMIDFEALYLMFRKMYKYGF